MEHEFDKEIDGLLRGFGRAERPLSAEAGPHIDADQLAAFLEGALPSTARANVIAHTANCDACRAIFATAVDLNQQLVPAELPVAAPVFVPKRRWRFLGMPAFAAALSGLLVVVFAGLIGVRYFSRADQSNIVARKTETEQAPPSAPSAVQNSAPTEPAASNSATVPSVSNSAANANAAAVSKAGRQENLPVTIPRSFAEPSADKADDGVATKQDSGLGGAARPPTVASAPAESEKKSAAGFQMDGVSPADTRRPEAKEVPSGAQARAKAETLSAKDRDQEKSASSPSTTRSVSGKTFTRRDGIWYDSAYKGGKTTNRAKTCDTCGVLEPGLQNIVNALPGTVIVVWKGRNLKFY
ncbi:MAG TPA: hypothetical protein PKC65_03045 [Pyrinomonadaceae bacterium]|nr:hypothetical protein [Pyrinomonadaceae bacterium]